MKNILISLCNSCITLYIGITNLMLALFLIFIIIYFYAITDVVMTYVKGSFTPSDL